MLGNGINRCVISNIAWGDLLSDVAKNNGVYLNENISFPMQFETIVSQILKRSNTPTKDVYEKVKQEIIDKLKNATLPNNAPHGFLTKNVDSVITTNYDFLIEQSIDKNFSIERNKMGNNKYNIKNSVLVFEKEVFHIHGDLRGAQSICLGYEHYARTVKHLIDSIASTKKNNNTAQIPTIIWALQNKVHMKTWAEKFFTDDVNIIGLGLTQSEIDIWWLITYRASLMFSNRYESKRLIKNNIIYHDIGIEPDRNMEFTLENLGVKYRFYYISKKDNEYYLQKYIDLSKSI